MGSIDFISLGSWELKYDGEKERTEREATAVVDWEEISERFRNRFWARRQTRNER